MMLPFLNIFGVAIAFPPLILLIGLWLGASLAEKHAHRQQVSSEVIYNLIFISLVAFVIGGRLGYAAQHPSAFINTPLNLLSRNFGLFDPISGAAIALIAGAIYGQRKNLKFWHTMDALTPAMAVFMIAVPLSNFASGNAFGSPSQLPWAVELWGTTRHPVQLYEALAAGMILWAVFPSRQKPFGPGSLFLQFIAYTTFARLFFEGLRGSSPITFFDLRIAQLIAWCILALTLWGLYKLRQNANTN